MKFSIDRHTLFAHSVPGFLVVMAVYALAVAPVQGGPNGFFNRWEGAGSLLGAASPQWVEILALVVGAIVVGEVIDAFRDLLEHLWDHVQPIKWDFLISGDQEKVARFVDRYFTFYVFDVNTSIALILVALSPLVRDFWELWILVVILLFNAVTLRREMARISQDG